MRHISLKSDLNRLYLAISLVLLMLIIFMVLLSGIIHKSKTISILMSHVELISSVTDQYEHVLMYRFESDGYGVMKLAESLNDFCDKPLLVYLPLGTCMSCLHSLQNTVAHSDFDMQDIAFFTDSQDDFLIRDVKSHGFEVVSIPSGLHPEESEICFYASVNGRLQYLLLKYHDGMDHVLELFLRCAHERRSIINAII